MCWWPVSAVQAETPPWPSGRHRASAWGRSTSEYRRRAGRPLHHHARPAQSRIAHGSLSGETILVDPAGVRVAVVDFRTASPSPAEERLDTDLAAALAVAGLVAGPERTAAAARRVLSKEVVAAALPHLRRASLDRAVSTALKGRNQLLEDVRVRTARAFDIEAPKLAESKRLSWGTIVMTVGTLIGGWALILVLIKVGQSFDTIKGAAWGWVAATAVLAQLAYPSTALSEIGTVNQVLPYGRVVDLEFANSFTSLAGGTPATFATRVRFFQQQGFDATQAVTSGALVSTTSWIVKGALFLISLPLAWGDLNFSEGRTEQARGTMARLSGCCWRSSCSCWC